MINILKDLREQASNVLNMQLPAIQSRQKLNDQLIEEIFIHKVELELQNLELIENQKQLEESNNKYAELYDFAPLGYFTIDIKGLISDVNKTGAEILGIKKNSLINRSFSRYVAPESQNAYANYFQLAFKNALLPHCEIKLLRRNARMFFVKLDGKVINESSFTEKKLLMMVTDIASHTKFEKNEVNELISQIINEINHPLGVITNYIHGCIKRLETAPHDVKKITEAMKQTSKQLSRISEIILKMKNFHLKRSLDFQLIPLDPLMKEVISLIKQEVAGFSIDIHYVPNKHIPCAFLDKLHIQHVILNIARNGIEAMRDANILDPKLIIEVNYYSKTAFEICILDNGPGFKQENIHKIFDSHFTTKSYGIGMGLAISRSIVEAHGGVLVADLNPTYGACFKCILPISQ